METASLENERLSTKLKECRDALEAQAASLENENERIRTELQKCQDVLQPKELEGLAKDFKNSMLHATLRVYKRNYCHVSTNIKLLKKSHQNEMREMKLLKESFKRVKRDMSSLKKSNSTLIAGLHLLTDNIDPETG